MVGVQCQPNKNKVIVKDRLKLPENACSFPKWMSLKYPSFPFSLSHGLGPFHLWPPWWQHPPKLLPDDIDKNKRCDDVTPSYKPFYLLPTGDEVKPKRRSMIFKGFITRPLPFLVVSLPAKPETISILPNVPRNIVICFNVRTLSNKGHGRYREATGFAMKVQTAPWVGARGYDL